MAKIRLNHKRLEGRKTRKKILREAIRLFSRHGYAGTSVQMIAESSGIGKSAVFWHFETKEKLLQAVLEKIIRDFILQVARAARDNKSFDEKSLLSLAIQTDKKITLRDTAGSRAVFALMIESANFDNEAAPVFKNRWNLYRDFLSNVVATGRKKGIFRRDVDPEWAGILIVGLLNGVFSQWFVDPEAVDLSESYSNIEKMVLDWLIPANDDGAEDNE
jgi:AcrR family transcriptional regulator